MLDPTPMSHGGRRKLTAWEVLAVSLTTPEYLMWFEVPIIFNRSNNLDFIPKLGRYPLILSPIIKDVKLNQVYAVGCYSPNILFLKTFV
jgi:hypothetical protein